MVICFVIIVIALLVIVRKSRNNGSDNYLSVGMILGVSLGLLLSNLFVTSNTGLLLCLGMFTDEAIGASIKKK